MRSHCPSSASSSPLPGLSFVRAALWAGLFAFLGGGAAHAITFSDTEFADADWTTISLDFGAPGAGGDIARGFQVASGGMPDAYRQSEIVFLPDPPPNVLEGIIGAHLRAGAVYDPSTQGAIDAIDLSYDVFIEPDSNAFGGILLRQGGIFYYGGGQNANANFWQSISFLLPASNFGTCEVLLGAVCAGTGTGNPDFSTSGGPIEFGFYQAVRLTSITNRTLGSRVDNWSVTVNRVPEPGTATLLLAGLLMLSRSQVRTR